MKQVKPFFFNDMPFMPYPTKMPKDYKPIRVITQDDSIFNVVQIYNGFSFEYINEVERIFLLEDDIKGWWYIN